jgi:hypothetical protein
MKANFEKLKEEEMKRWSERELFLRQEFARELGIHQGRLSVFEENIQAESEIEESTE